MKNANTTEIDSNTESPVVVEMPEHNTGDKGGSMRLGKRTTIFKTTNSILSKYSFIFVYIIKIHFII